MLVQEFSENVRPKIMSALRGNAEAYFGGSQKAVRDNVNSEEEARQEPVQQEEERPRYLNANAMLIDTMEYQKLDVQDHSDLTAASKNIPSGAYILQSLPPAKITKPKYSAESFYPFTDQFPPPSTSSTSNFNSPHESRTLDEDQTGRERAPEKDHQTSLNRILEEYKSKPLSSRTQLEVPTATIEDREPVPRRAGILRPPRETFPEDPDSVREGVSPLSKKGIPPNARWTKIDRKLVNPQALEQGDERFEERGDSVIVFRVLTKEEIELYARRTQEIRDMQSRSLLKPNINSTNGRPVFLCMNNHATVGLM